MADSMVADSMAWDFNTLAFCGVAAVAFTASFPKLQQRLQLSRAKHPSLGGHARMARRMAKLVPSYAYDDRHFFSSDGAPTDIATRRQAGFKRLAGLYETRFAESVRRSTEVMEGISDLQFTDRYRVPFQFSHLVQTHLRSGTFLQS